MASAPPAPFIAPYAGELDVRLQIIAEQVSQNMVAIAQLQQRITALGGRIAALEAPPTPPAAPP
jgi:hypothetical protein